MATPPDRPSEHPEDHTGSETSGSEYDETTSHAARALPYPKPAATVRRPTTVARKRSSISSFISPAAIRQHFLAQVIDIFCPTDMAPELLAAVRANYVYVEKCKALAIALDAAVLLQLGQHVGHAPMITAGKKLYVAALRLMVNEVGLPPGLRSDGGIAAAISNLQICEFSAAMITDDSSWKSHASGLNSLLRVSRPTEDDYKSLLDVNFLLFHIWYGLITRQAIDSVNWPDIGNVAKIVQKVPGMLQESDNVLLYGHSTLPTLTVRIVRSLKDAEQKLSIWAAQWKRDPEDPPYSMVDPDQLERAGAPRGSFLYMYAFKDLATAQKHAACTACLLSVRRAILDVDAMLMSSSSSGDEAGNKRLQHNRTTLIHTTNDCADSLCMSLPYMHLPEHGKYGVLGSVGPLHIASSWYKTAESGAAARKKLAWCTEMAARIHERGFRSLS